MITNTDQLAALAVLTPRNLRQTARDIVLVLRHDSMSRAEIRNALSSLDNVLAELDKRETDPEQAHYLAPGYSLTTVWQRRSDGLYDGSDGVSKGYSLHGAERLIPCAFGKTKHNPAACLARSVFDRFEVEIQTSRYTDAGEHVHGFETRTVSIASLYSEFERKAAKGERRHVRVTDAWRHGHEDKEN